MSLPALKAFKEQTGGHLTYAVDLSVSAVLCRLVWIDHVVDYRTVDLSSYDVIHDISSLAMEYEFPGREIKNRIDIYADALGVVLKTPLPEYVVHWTEREETRRWRATSKMVLIVSIDTLDPIRDWPIKHWQTLVGLLAGYPVQILLSDMDPTRIWDQSNVTRLDVTFRELAALIQQADLFVGSDSGPMHLAGALGTRSVVLFGAIPPGARLNHYPTHTAVQSPTACQGWHRQHCGSKCCMGDLTPEYVFQQILLALENPSPIESN